MTYQILDDRPGECEGCRKKDYPGQFRLSVQQITWNDVLKLWLCVECQYEWSNWMSRDHETESLRLARKPGFLVELEKKHERSADGSGKA